MTRVPIGQFSFAGGEQGEHLYGRFDLSKFMIGCRQLQNMIPLVHGPIVNRPGTRYLAHTRPVYAAAALHPGDDYYPSQDNIYAKPWLVGFEYSETDTYMLEVGRGYIRPYRNQGAILEGSALTIHDITEPGTYPNRTLVEMFASHGYQHGDMIYIVDCTGETAPNGRFWYVRRLEGIEEVVTSVTENVVLQGAAQGVTSVTDTSGVARVVTAAPHGYSDGWKVWLTGVSGDMGDAVNELVWVITNASGSTFDLVGIDVTGIAAGAGGNVDRVTSNLARVVTSSSNDMATSDAVYIDGVSSAMGTYVNDQYWTVTRIDATTFDLQSSDPIRIAQGAGGWCDAVARATSGAGGPIADDEFYLMDMRMDDVDMGASGLDWGTYTQDSGTAQRRYELRADRMTDKATLPYQDFPTTRLHRVQSADVMVFAAQTRDFAARELIRADHDDWSIAIITFQAAVSAPVPVLTEGAMAGSAITWQVTAISEATGEESAPGSVTSKDPNPSVAGTGIAITVEWPEVSGAQYYHIYRTDESYQRAGFCGIVDNVAGEGPFQFHCPAGANAIDPNYTIGAPRARSPFEAGDGSNDCPGTLMFHEQRLFMASTLDAPQEVWFSARGAYYNMNDSVPVQAEDSSGFIVSSQKENQIQNLISLRELVIQTTAREFKVSGSGGNLIAATAGGIQALPETHRGSGPLQAIAVGASALFVSDVGPSVHDMTYDYTVDGYSGSDLSVLVRHMLDGYDLVDWDHAAAPYHAFWLVRSDGTLLEMTFHKEHNVWAWSTHPMTNGSVGSVGCVREGREHVTYLAVTREIDGNIVEYIEVMTSRDFRNYDKEWDVRNAIFLDCSLTYDEPFPAIPGYDDTANYIDGSGGFVMTDASEFTADSDWAGGPNWDGDWVDLDEFQGTGGIEAYLNGKRFYVAENAGGVLTLVVYESPEDYTEIDATITGGWTMTRFGTVRRAVATITNLHHLEGETPSLLVNGNVAAAQTVTDGSLTLGDDVERGSRIHIGLPIVAQFESHDAESPDPAQPIGQYPQRLAQCTLFVRNSRGIQWGPDEDHLTEYKVPPNVAFGSPLPMENGRIYGQILEQTAEWDHARLVVRQVHPLPLEIQGMIREIDLAIPAS